jgi:catechol 2,3-dioxygenase-like lactoylglutathione lyase family enzyme
MAIDKVQLFSVPVADQARARDFYVDILGFELIADNPMGPDQRWVQVGPKGAATSITLVTWFKTMPAGSVQGIVLESDDLEADVKQLTERGVKFDGQIQEQSWGRIATFSDPDGNGFVLRISAPAGA